MATMPDVTVEIAFPDGYTTPAASRTWTDVTAYVDVERLVSIGRGRPDQFDQPQPSRLSLTLNNRDGRFTPEYAAGAYYPNVKKGRPIRVRATALGNLLSENIASIETSAAWDNQGATSVVQSATRAVHGTKSLLITWPASIGGVRVRTGTISGITVGLTYTFSVSVWVPAGSPDVRLTGEGAFGAAGTQTSLKDQWVRLTLTDTAAAGTPNFTVSPMSGTGTVYVDAAMVELGSSAGTFTTAPTTTYDRFLGYVDEWPVEWPGGSDAYSTVTVSATSRMARLGLSGELKSIVEEEILADDPVLYYPLGEPQGALEAGNIAPARSERLVVTQIGSGGTLEFGAGTGPGTDDLTAPVFTPVDSANGLFLRVLPIDPLATGTNGFVEVEFFCATSTVSQLVAKLPYFSSTLMGLRILLDSSGRPQALVNLTDSTTVSADSATSVTDGSTHHISCRWVMSGTNTVTPSIMVDGGTRVTGTPTSGALLANPLPIRLVDFGGHGFVPGAGSGSGTGAFVGTLSHLSITTGVTPPTDARVTAHANAGLNGYTSDSSDLRIDRYARLAGIPTAEVSAETGRSTSIAHVDTTGQSPIQMMQAVALTEDGVVFDGKDGTLTFHSRSHRYGATSAFTLSCAIGEVEADFRPVLDDQGMTNDMTASRPDGATARSVNQASIGEYGYYRDTVELMTTSDNEVQSRADWQVNRFGTPRVKVTSVSVDVINSSSAQIAALLASDIGTRFTLTNLPVQAPSSTMDLFIEGIAESIGPEFYTITFNTSAAAYADVWILDSSTWSVLDSTSVPAY